MWKQLQEWKRIIALTYWCITVPLIPMWFPNNQLASNINTTIGIILSTVGMSSALAKKYQLKITEEV